MSHETLKMVPEFPFEQELLFPSNSEFEQEFYVALENSTIKDVMLQTLHEPPFYGIIWKDGHWSSDYVLMTMKATEACQDRQVCDHGITHDLEVAENMIKTGEMINIGIDKNDQMILPEGDFFRVFSKSALISVAFLHDKEYGFEDFDWEGKHDQSHLLKKKTLIGDFLENYVLRVLPNKIDLKDSKAIESLMLLQNLLPMYKKAVDMDTHTAVTEVEMLSTKELLNSEMFFPVVFKYSDIAAYFNSVRLHGIARPVEYCFNPFFFSEIW